MGFRQRFAKKAGTERPSSSVLFRWPQSPWRALPFCSSRQLPGLSDPRASYGAHSGRPSGEPLCSMTAGRPPKRAPLFLPPEQQPPHPTPDKGTRRVRVLTADLVLHTADYLRGCAEWGVPRVQGVQDRDQRGRDGFPPGKIPAAWCIAEPWGQAWLWGMKGYPAHQGPRPSDTYHTEP